MCKNWLGQLVPTGERSCRKEFSHFFLKKAKAAAVVLIIIKVIIKGRITGSESLSAPVTGMGPLLCFLLSQ